MNVIKVGAPKNPEYFVWLCMEEMTVDLSKVAYCEQSGLRPDDVKVTLLALKGDFPIDERQLYCVVCNFK